MSILGRILKGDNRSYLTAILIRVGGAGLMFLMNIVLARVAGADVYGVIAVGIATGLVAMNLGSLGFSTSSMRFVAAFRHKKEAEQLKSFLVTALTVTAGGAGLGVIISLSINITGQQFQLLDTKASSAFLFALPLIVIFPFIDLLGGMQRGYEEIAKALLPYNIVFPAFVIALCGAFWLIAPASFDERVAFWCLYAAASATILWAGLLLYQRWPRGGYQIRKADRRSWLKTSFAMIPGLASSFAVRQIDAIVLSFFVMPTQIAIYWFAGRICRLAGFGLQAAHMVASPQFAKLRSEADHLALAERRTDQNYIAKMQNAASGAARATAIMAFPIIAGLFFAGPFLLSLAGKEYAGGLIILYIVLMGELVNVLCGLNSAFMNMTDLQNELAKISIVTLVLYLVLVGVGSALYGIIGAAIAVSAVTAIQNFLTSFTVYRLVGVNTTMFSRYIWRTGGVKS